MYLRHQLASPEKSRSRLRNCWTWWWACEFEWTRDDRSSRECSGWDDCGRASTRRRAPHDYAGARAVSIVLASIWRAPWTDSSSDRTRPPRSSRWRATRRSAGGDDYRHSPPPLRLRTQLLCWTWARRIVHSTSSRTTTTTTTVTKRQAAVDASPSRRRDAQIWSLSDRVCSLSNRPLSLCYLSTPRHSPAPRAPISSRSTVARLELLTIVHCANRGRVSNFWSSYKIGCWFR